MVDDFVVEVKYLEYLQKGRCMNDNDFFTTIYKKKKLYNFIVHTVGNPENISRDTTFKPGSAKLCPHHDRISLQVKGQYLEEKISYLKVGPQDRHKHCDDHIFHCH